MLKRIVLSDFRNYGRREFSFAGPVTALVGPNGAGKSNLLEAVFFLGLLRSFRTGKLKEMIRAGARTATVEAALEIHGWQEIYRVEYDADGRRRLAVGGNPVARSSEFIKGVQPVVFAPEDRLLVTGNAATRRRFFDMLIALADTGYWRALQNYHAALVRRNAAIRSNQEAVARAFEPELARAAAEVAATRRAWTARLEEAVRRRLENEEFALEYRNDYPEDPAGYLAHFERNRRREARAGFTLFGPQLDEFKIDYRGLAARSYASTGQGRRLAILLKLAATELLRADAEGGEVVALVDDVTGDLDGANRERFLAELAPLRQSIFTFTAPPGESFFRGAEIVSI